ncbi:MAG: protein kinase, partial [Acidobacteria bacterium]|nr:protein kinase [Acidobacteriota bacterium]NIQ30686.1 protein kinase [Acidobacteriota bacterium]NIQ85644.1 protein kinase [Acidobacteriota bacterium]
MTIEPGQMLLHYRLVEKIGEGGMGIVWKALDTNLDRDVAIKILPDTFAGDASRLARFEREAKTLASLSHPNIATVHGLHDAEGVRFLAMELVSGEDLAQRLARGSLPPDEAVGVALQVATALEAAHESGVVHRDLKPANILLTPEGTVKVLDFGLAKILEPETGEADPSLSPTMTAHMTGAGVILGTAAYMSPEQARGQEIDKRADVWAFGCVLFEMLTGKPPFGGATVTDVLARVLEREPEWANLPAGVGSPIRRLLSRCLAKEASNRLRDIGDARIELSSVDEAGASDEPTSDPGRRLFMGVLILGLGLVVGYSIGLITRGSGARGSDRADAVRRLSVRLADDQPLGWSLGIDLSADGSELVYPVGASGGPTQLYLRRLDRFESAPIPNTERATFPELSPDGTRIAFSRDSKVYVQPLSGGRPAELCDVVSQVWGIDWTSDDTIVFGNLDESGLRRVPATGGPCETVIAPDIEAGESWYFFPEVLPGGEWILFSAATRDILVASEGSIVAASTRTNEKRTLVDGADRAFFVEPDRLLFSRGEQLFVAEFDPSNPRLEGTPTLLADRIHESKVYGAHAMAVAGPTMIFVPPHAEPSRSLVWIDRQGNETTAVEDAAGVYGLRLSPDGSRAALATGWVNHQYWILDVARGSRTRLNLEGDNHNAVWSPDGRDITFVSNRLGMEKAFRQPADGSREAELFIDEVAAGPLSWSRDGRYLLYTKPSEDKGMDVWVYDLEQDSRFEF